MTFKSFDAKNICSHYLRGFPEPSEIFVDLQSGKFWLNGGKVSYFLQKKKNSFFLINLNKLLDILFCTNLIWMHFVFLSGVFLCSLKLMMSLLLSVKYWIIFLCIIKNYATTFYHVAHRVGKLPVRCLF